MRRGLTVLAVAGWLGVHAGLWTSCRRCRGDAPRGNRVASVHCPRHCTGQVVGKPCPGNTAGAASG
jgi:hypothetical protein